MWRLQMCYYLSQLFIWWGVFWLHIELQYSEHEQLVVKEIFKDIVWFLQGLVILNISLSVDK